MSKTTDHILLVPGESGWEIWTQQADAPFTLQNASITDRAAELSPLPAGDILLLFPVRSLTALPMRVTSDDEALFADLAALHAERLGLRPDPLAGQLTDVFVIAREAENSALLSILLRTPVEGDLPTRGPKAFDISPRAYTLPGDAITVWKEFGRWVFALSYQGKLVYCQATSIASGSPDDALAREIRLALMQLSMQGLEINPAHLQIWSNTEGISTAHLEAAFKLRASVGPRPAPTIPDPLSKLLPADVRAARRAALKRRNILLGVAAVAIAYFGVIAWAGYGLWKNSSETRSLLAEADAAAPDTTAYAEHVAKWDELSPAIDLQYSPVDILSRIASCIPMNSGLRLRSAEISATEVKLAGEAPEFQAVQSFSLNLDKNNDLARFKWQKQEPNQSTRGWEFNYTGDLEAAP